MDWRVYNNPEVDDKKLLDLYVWYGHPFPRKNADGSEIVPESSDESTSLDSNRSEDYYQDSPHSESTEKSVSDFHFESSFYIQCMSQDHSPLYVTPTSRLFLVSSL